MRRESSGHRPGSAARGRVLARGGFVLSAALFGCAAGVLLLGGPGRLASADDGLPAGASSLIATDRTPIGSTEAAPAASSTALRDDLMRDAFILDFAGYHTGAAQVIRLLVERYPEDPAVAIAEVEHEFWPQLYDVGPVRDDAALISSIARALELTRAEHRARPRDIEAHALYGRALMHDARRLALDGYLLKAGAQGENAREELEKVLAVAPEDDESRYLLANYYYWAGVLPAYLKAVSWLWFVPKGDRQDGLAMLQAVSDGDSLYADSADVILSVVGIHHAPPNLADAHSRLMRLHVRYPRNVLIQHELIDLLFKMERFDEVERELDEMELREREPQPVEAYGVVSTLWRARIALHQRRVDDAARLLDRLASQSDRAPNWADAWTDVLRGQLDDLRGNRERARIHYQRALDREGVEESQRADRMARAGLEAPFDPDRFEHPYLLTGD